MAKMKIKCCIKCTKRYPGCHSSCEVYATEKSEYEAEKEKILKAKHEGIEAYQVKRDSIIRRRRRKTKWIK